MKEINFEFIIAIIGILIMFGITIRTLTNVLIGTLLIIGVCMAGCIRMLYQLSDVIFHIF
ncbi:hypothetical protein GCM10008022_03050 [Paenibacillus hunanensis]|uniref:Uncharacterized protein n=1 Tax=Paenibacillus hunanensis TaxID=539262 RepID=A0ABU1IWQ5_9BACL|nr:hypothetical protein [Paenibacillus hunanensis]GGI97747.1 hypothetical protein GCM10008022_03050 [Paenibacillus hunanensis]